MAVGGRSTLEKNSLPDSSGSGVGLGFLALAPSAPKLFGFGGMPRGACPLPAFGGHRLCSSSSQYGHREVAEPLNVLV